MQLSFKKIIRICLISAVISNTASATDFSITSNNIENLAGVLTSVSPAVNDPVDADEYLDSNSALGYYGPIGSYGPLGTLGPIGNNSWNTSYWISAIGSWSDWSENLTDLGGPLSEAGALGPDGPISDISYDTILPGINDFGKQLQAGGVWTVLGPVGPLGALGPLGPLGPIGAHGYSTDFDGSYLDNGNVVRNVNVDYDGGQRSYELFENYKESYAKSATDNDTSFMVEGYISYPYSETDTYEFTSGDDQYVTITLVPMYTLDDFDIVVKDENGEVIEIANTADYVDFIQLNNISSGTTLTVEVTLYSTAHYHFKDYRLYVVGSTSYISTTDPITGDHQSVR